MKQTIMSLLGVFALCASANAALVNCSSTLVQLTAGGSSPTFTCDGLTFSNFVLTNLSGTNGGHLDINSVNFDNTTNEVFLDENPNLGPGGHENLFFTVTGGITNIDLSVGGTGATVTERACANPIPLTGPVANLCSNVAQTTSVTPLGQVTVTSGEANQPIVSSFARTTPVYIFKDIAVAGGPGTGLSTMNESFGAGAVPEPTTLALFGSGILLLAGVRRRRK